MAIDTEEESAQGEPHREEESAPGDPHQGSPAFLEASNAMYEVCGRLMNPDKRPYFES